LSRKNEDSLFLPQVYLSDHCRFGMNTVTVVPPLSRAAIVNVPLHIITRRWRILFSAILHNDSMSQYQKDLARSTYWYNQKANTLFDTPNANTGA